MNAEGDLATTPIPTNATTATASERLPSSRPIDHRWDRSRGIIFSNARRALTHSWSHGGGITLVPASVSPRGYATRTLGAQPVAQAQPIDRQNSIVNNPHKVPVFNMAPQSADLENRLAKAEEGWKRERAELDSTVKSQESKMAKLKAENTKLQHQREVDVREISQQTVNHKAAMEQLRTSERAASAERISALENRAIQSEAARRVAARKADELEELTNRAVQQHSKELLDQRQMMDRQRTAELHAVARGRQLRKDHERDSYEAYRKVYDDLNIALSRFSDQAVLVENARYAAAKFMQKQPSYSSQMKKYDPWFEHKYPRLVQRLDRFLKEHTAEVEDSGNAIKDMRYRQQQIQDSLRGSAHVSRALTRYHHLNDDPSKLAMADIVGFLANDRPFRERRDELDAEIKDLDRTIAREKSETLAAHQRRELVDLQNSRSTLSRVLAIHAKLRDTEALRALLIDSHEEKEVFAATLKPNIQVDEAARAWQMLIGSDPYVDEDSDVSVGEQRTVRRSYMDKAREIRTTMREVQRLVRRRSLLEQNLGRVSGQRVRELDAVIRERITLKKVEERSAFARLGVARASRSSSFARAPFPAPIIRPRVSDSKLKSPSSANLSANEDTTRSDSANGLVGLETAMRNIRRQLGSMANNSSSVQKASAALLKLRKVYNERSIAVLETKMNSALQLDPPDTELAIRYEVEIKRKRDALSNEQVATPSDIRTQIQQTRKRIYRRKEAGRKQQSTKDGTSTSRLNIQPSAVKKAAHNFWPDGSRYFHAGSILSDSPTENSVQAERLPDFDPFCFADRDIEGQIAEAPASATTRSPLPWREWQTGPRVSSPSSAQQDAETVVTTRAIVPMNSAAVGSEQDISESQTPSSMQHRVLESEASVSDIVENVENEGMGDNGEESIALIYHISATDYRNAVKASRNSSAAFWSYKLYKNAEGKPPSVHFCRFFKQAEEQMQKFLDEPVLGFDIEWEPFKRSSIKDNVSLIQIAAEDKIAVIHIANFVGDTVEQLMPPSLRKVLESDTIIKAGVNVAGDARRLKQYLNVEMNGLFELSHLYKVVHYTEAKMVNKKLMSLANQVQSVLLLPLKKDDNVRTSAWAKRLKMEQVEYSASDAYAGFRLFHALDDKRKKMDPMPPLPAYYELHQPLVLGDGTALQRKPAAKAAPGKAAEVDEDADDEFFDALETQDDPETDTSVVTGVPLSGLDVVYPILPKLETLSMSCEQDEQPVTAQKQAQTTDSSSGDTEKQTLAPAKQSAPPRPEIEQADAWVASWQASLLEGRKLRCSKASLRAWHLWHKQSLGISHVAALLRDPPLAPVTVASYILQAIKEENLIFDADRVKEALDLMPSSVLWRYHKIAQQVPG